MNNEQKLILQLMDGFRNNKGKASCYAYKPLKPENIIAVFISAHRQKRTDTNILIVVRDYNERIRIKEILDSHNLSQNVTILSKTYINLNYRYEYCFTFIIGVNDDYPFLMHLHNQSKFTFAIFTEYCSHGVFNDWVSKNLPVIKTNISTNDLVKDRFNYPVEEMHCAVELSDDDKQLSDKYDEYISVSMSIFGNFENADKCRVGDLQLNISAGEFRYQLAKENGWSETLDTSLDFNKQIDDVYNPNALFERANTLYNIIRERTNLLTDNKSKLDKIVEIIKKNPNKKILIVSKRGEFANTIANYINETTELLCGEYHDCIPEQYVLDDNGNYITYKSGENKGKRKLFKSKALSTMALNRFNSTDNELSINLLSTKNSADTELKTAIDLIIFTSSLCFSPNEFIQRFADVEFTTNPLKTFVIYCANTTEHNKLNNRTITQNVVIIEEEKNFIVDENNGGVYL